MDTKEPLRNQITDSSGNVQYTYIAHWVIVDRLQKRYKGLKIAQIVLTAASTGGFLSSLLSGISALSWIGGATSAIALGLNLYSLNFNLSDEIKSHKDAANELWDVREAYRSLLTDFDTLEIKDIQKRRDDLIGRVSDINKKYPGTDDKAFKKAQEKLKDYKFKDGEAVDLMYVDKRK